MGFQALVPLWAKCAPVIVLGLAAYALLQAAEFSRQVREAVSRDEEHTIPKVSAHSCSVPFSKAHPTQGNATEFPPGEDAISRDEGHATVPLILEEMRGAFRWINTNTGRAAPQA